MRTIRIAVAGDIHLGKRQYNSPVREKDFQEAWFWVCSTAAARNPDFFIIAGDLFDNKIGDPVSLSAAVSGLSDNGLGTVLAVEGNHDGRSFVNKGRSWVEYLNSQDHIDHVLRLGESFHGGGIFFCGSPWAGRNTQSAFEGMIWDADIGAKDDFRVGVIHAAPEGYVFGSGGVSIDLMESQTSLDIVLMGHCHKSFGIGGKILCGGSPEVCDAGEIGISGGLWIIDIDLDGKSWTTEFLKYTPRPFVKLEVDSSHGIMAHRVLFVPEAQKPVVIVDIVGKRETVDFSHVKSVVGASYSPIVIKINDKMEARESLERKSNSHSFERSVTRLLGGEVTFKEFGEVFDCYEKQDVALAINALGGPDD